ncbi:MAG: SDR family NAD(P)-dependent oxidoreductase [Flavobacteriales bacterium]|nr:SDR family NAD(P)-dependent oxidoreductase [Flavobacteriales bacterium]
MTALALVTGGSSGIGLAIAHRLAQRGHNLLLVGDREHELNPCAIDMERQHGITCHTLCIDLAATDAAQRAFDHCAAQGFEVDMLVNNAGMLLFSEAVLAPKARAAAILLLHVHTPTMLCRLFGEQMRANGRGHVLNVSSISAVMPYPGISLYGPTKTYMRYYTRALRNELKGHGVHVTCLLPGATETGLYDPKRVNIPLAKRLGVMHSPQFVAERAVNALLSDRAECIPGWVNRLTMMLLPAVPSWVIRFIHRSTGLTDTGQRALG